MWRALSPFAESARVARDDIQTFDKIVVKEAVRPPIADPVLGEAFEQLQEEQHDLIRRISQKRARTVAGALAQLRVVELGIQHGEAKHDRTAMRHVLATLERLASATDHVSATQAVPSGTIRVAAPVELV